MRRAGKSVFEFGASHGAVGISVRGLEESGAEHLHRLVAAPLASAAKTTKSPGAAECGRQQFGQSLGQVVLAERTGLVDVEFIEPGFDHRSEFLLGEFLVSVLVSLRDQLPGQGDGRAARAPARTVESAELPGSLDRGHRGLFVQPGDGDDQGTGFAVARGDDFAVLSAFEGGFEGVETQAASLPLLAVTTEAGGFEEGSNIFFVGDPRLVGGGREFGEVRLSRWQRPRDGRETQGEQSRRMVHDGLAG